MTSCFSTYAGRAGAFAMISAALLLSATHPARAQISIDTTLGGAIRVGESNSPCDGTTVGGVRYNSSSGGSVQFCNGGGTWQNIGGGAVGALNDLSDVIADYTTAHNMFLGSGSGTSTTSTGTYNVGLGYNTLNTNVGGRYNVAIGYEALRYADSTADADKYNVAVGFRALRGTATASNNTHRHNVAIGYQAMMNVSESGGNVAIGTNALRQATTGIGEFTGNVAIGMEAGESITGGYGNVTIGFRAQRNLDSVENIVIGHEALRDATDGPYSSVIIGNYALRDGNPNGANFGNTIIGHEAGQDVATGGNTFVGYQAGTAGTPITTGDSNVLIGYQAQADGNNYTNGTAIGNGAVLTGSDRIVLGNTSITGIYAQVTSITALSDERRKKDIEPLGPGLDFISKLRPVSYRFNNGDETLRYGFIAQELGRALPADLQNVVETAAPQHGLALLERENDPDRTYRVSYGELTAPMIKAIQEQQAIIDRQRAQIDALEARMTATCGGAQ